MELSSTCLRFLKWVVGKKGILTSEDYKLPGNKYTK